MVVNKLFQPSPRISRICLFDLFYQNHVNHSVQNRQKSPSTFLTTEGRGREVLALARNEMLQRALPEDHGGHQRRPHRSQWQWPAWQKAAHRATSRTSTQPQPRAALYENIMSTLNRYIHAHLCLHHTDSIHRPDRELAHQQKAKSILPTGIASGTLIADMVKQFCSLYCLPRFLFSKGEKKRRDWNFCL